MKEQTDKRKKIIIIVVAAILVIVAVAIFLYFNSKIRATTMRILRMEGEVTLEECQKGRFFLTTRRSSGALLRCFCK